MWEGAEETGDGQYNAQEGGRRVAQVDVIGEAAALEELQGCRLQLRCSAYECDDGKHHEHGGSNGPGSRALRQLLILHCLPQSQVEVSGIFCSIHRCRQASDARKTDCGGGHKFIRAFWPPPPLLLLPMIE